MALDRLTKVDGGGISTISDYRVGIITATKFVGPVEGTITSTDANFSGNVTIGGTLTYEDVTNIDSVGIITAQSDVHVGGGVSAVGVGTFSGLDISGDIDVDGHTNLDNVSIAGVTTFVGNIDANGDIDVDGHTNLDNVSIAGVSTFSDDIFIPDDKNIKFGNTFASPDLEIFHNSSVDYNEIKNNTGVLRIRNHDTDPANKYIYIQSERIQLRSHTNNHSMISAFAGAQVELYHNNVKRLETSSVGVSIPQDLDVDGHTNLDNVSVAGVTTFTGNANFGSNGSITSAANFTLSSNKLRVTGSDTVGIECQRASNATIQCTETTNNTDLQLRANSAGGLVRTATNKALNLGTNQKNRIQITNDGKVQIGLPGNSTSLPAGTEVVNIRAMTDGNLHIRAIGNIASSPTGTGVGIDVLNDASNAVKDLALRGSTVIFRSATAETLRITSTGNVGIGTDPSYDVDIRNGTSARVAIDVTTGSDAAIWMDGMDADFAGSDYWGLKAQSSGEFAIFRAASEKLRITTGGAVTLSGTTTSARNAGISTSTGSIIYNSTVDLLQVYTGTVWKNVRFGQSGDLNISYLVVGGGGAGGGFYRGGGGGAGALRTNWNNESQGGGQSSGAAKTITAGTAYSIILGAGGQGNYNANGSDGGTSTFDDIVSNGGAGGARYERNANTNTGNGSGGGGGGHTGTTRAGGAAGTYGYAGGNGSNSGSYQCGGGGGGAAAAGGNGGGGGTDGDGGAALANTISGSSVDYAGGAGGGNYGGGNTTIGGGAGAPAGSRGSASAPGLDASIANRGSGGGGAGGANVSGGAGSSGVVILRFSSLFTASFSNGVTHSSVTNGGETIVTITATLDSSQTVTFV
tara:strand:- start:65 stop:2644 length:2580 start_codon:yes stop_codon:yes gene_type:complete